MRATTTVAGALLVVVLGLLLRFYSDSVSIFLDESVGQYIDLRGIDDKLQEAVEVDGVRVLVVAHGGVEISAFHEYLIAVKVNPKWSRSWHYGLVHAPRPPSIVNPLVKQQKRLRAAIFIYGDPLLAVCSLRRQGLNHNILRRMTQGTTIAMQSVFSYTDGLMLEAIYLQFVAWTHAAASASPDYPILPLSSSDVHDPACLARLCSQMGSCHALDSLPKPRATRADSDSLCVTQLRLGLDERQKEIVEKMASFNAGACARRAEAPRASSSSADKAATVKAGQALWDAAHSGVIIHLQKAIQRATELNRTAVLNFPNPSTGNTPIVIAACAGRLDAVKLLALTPGVDVNQGNNDQMTALHFAAFYGRYNILKALIQTARRPSPTETPALPVVDIQAVNNDGWSALHAAASTGQMNSIEILLAAGVRPNITAHSGLWRGYTALGVALGKGHLSAAVALALMPAAQETLRSHHFDEKRSHHFDEKT